MTPLQWTIGAGFLVVAVAGFLRFMSGPAFYRRKPAAFLSDIAATLAGQPQGSILIMDHKGSECFLQFRKPADTGKVEQAILFGFPEVEWSRAFFGEVVARVDDSGFPYEVVSRRQDGSSTRFLEVTLYGDRSTLGRQALSLVSPILEVLGFDDDDRFTFHVDSPYWDPELDARVATDFWQTAARNAPTGWIKRYAEQKAKLGRVDP